MTKKTAAGLDALANIGSEQPKEKASSEPTKQEAPLKKTKAFPLHLPTEVHQVLRELAFHENTSMTKIILEGVDISLKNRGLASIKELTNT